MLGRQRDACRVPGAGASSAGLQGWTRLALSQKCIHQRSFAVVDVSYVSDVPDLVPGHQGATGSGGGRWCGKVAEPRQWEAVSS